MEEIVVRPISAETRLREKVQESILTMNMKREKAAFKVQVIQDHETTSVSSRRASRRAGYERQKSQDIRRSVYEMCEKYQEEVDRFDDKMRQVSAREVYRMEKQEQAKQDIYKTAG